MLVRVLRTVKATLTRSFYLDEVAGSASGPVAVSVTRLDGTLVESGVATPDGGGYSYTFGGRDVVDELILSWSLTVGGDAMVLDQDRIQVVGGFLFGLAEGRAVDSSLASTTRYPTSMLVEKRIEVEDECERICGQAFVPRFRRAVLSSNGGTALVLPDPVVRAVRSVSLAGVAYTVGQLADVTWSDTGLLYRPAGWPVGARNVVVEYEHGHDFPPPDINRVAKIRFKSMVLQSQSALPDRAERVVTVDAQGGSVVYGSPSANRTGIPEVDAAYARFVSPRPGFG